jgi:hypothetical protein
MVVLTAARVPDLPSPRRESVRLRSVLRGLSMPIDILVVSERRLAELAERPGLIYREAIRTGRTEYEAG